ncbi:MAG: dTMP kinase [Promethearchaeota archaeon]
MVFEGSHGSGKTTQAHLLIGFNSLYSKEPFLDDLKPIIEKYSRIQNNISAYLLLYLHTADRYVHINFIKEKSKNGTVIISDRYFFSSLVYQRIQGIPIPLIKQLNHFCIIPQITFIFNLPLIERKKKIR